MKLLRAYTRSEFRALYKEMVGYLPMERDVVGVWWPTPPQLTLVAHNTASDIARHIEGKRHATAC